MTPQQFTGHFVERFAASGIREQQSFRERLAPAQQAVEGVRAEKEKRFATHAARREAAHQQRAEAAPMQR
jgi:uncharacterized membrane-anchored protein YhcB (DUF1043 family)